MMSQAQRPLRVLLVCLHPLLCEGLVSLLARETSLALVGPVTPAEALATLQAQAPEPEIDAIILAGDPPDEASQTMLGNLLTNTPRIPVIQVRMSARALRVYLIQEAPASPKALLDALGRVASSTNPIP